jgi:hypothetical protein
VAYSIAIGDSTGATDTAQLVRGVTEDFQLVVELLVLAPRKGKTAFDEIFSSIGDSLANINCF